MANEDEQTRHAVLVRKVNMAWHIEVIDSHLKTRVGRQARQLGVSTDVLLRYCATAQDPPDGIWEALEYVEYGDRRIERHFEELFEGRISAEMRELYRQIGPGSFVFNFRDLPVFAFYLELNRLRLTDVQVRDMGYSVVSTADFLASAEMDEDRQLEKRFGNRPTEGLTRLVKKLTRALSSRDYGHFDDQWNELMKILGTRLWRFKYNVWDPGICSELDRPELVAHKLNYASKRDRAAMLASLQAFIAQRRRGPLPQLGMSELEGLAAAHYHALTGLSPSWSNADNDGGHYGSFLKRLFEAISVLERVWAPRAAAVGDQTWFAVCGLPEPTHRLVRNRPSRQRKPGRRGRRRK